MSAGIGSACTGPYFAAPPLYSLAMSRDSSMNATCHSAVGGSSTGGLFIVVSMKFSLTPLTHGRFDFLQFWQIGFPSSHFKCLSLHVKQPVRTLLGLFSGAARSVAPGVSAAPSLLSIAVPCWWWSPTAATLLRLCVRCACVGLFREWGLDEEELTLFRSPLAGPV